MKISIPWYWNKITWLFNVSVERLLSRTYGYSSKEISINLVILFISQSNHLIQLRWDLEFICFFKLLAHLLNIILSHSRIFTSLLSLSYHQDLLYIFPTSFFDALKPKFLYLTPYNVRTPALWSVEIHLSHHELTDINNPYVYLSRRRFWK